MHGELYDSLLGPRKKVRCSRCHREFDEETADMEPDECKSADQFFEMLPERLELLEQAQLSYKEWQARWKLEFFGPESK